MQKKCIYYLLMLHSLIMAGIPGIPNQNNNPVRSHSRLSSYPYISGDTFRAFSDHIFDETNIPFDVKKIGHGDIVFVRNDALKLFFSHYHDKIPHQYILVTHNNDYPNPGPFAHYLDDPKIIKWFAENGDCVHEKLVHIPIGLPNHFWPHGNEKMLKELQPKAKSLYERKSCTVFLNFSLHTNVKAREPIWNHFVHKPFCVVRKGQSQRAYLHDMNQCTFVISPPGNALDCHRTWEAMYLGCIPLLEHSPLDPLFDDLPVIFIDDWREVDRSFLEKKLLEVQSKTYNLDKLYADYWFGLIRSVQKEVQAS